uniref:Uncharacterized protein n=1 Tax=Setaria viridis TaxID=4556 RepID=A0A4U6TGI4_SETVI|nr:hypothetical protein SEVIR_9G425050v2 [Setaria viridis]
MPSPGPDRASLIPPRRRGPAAPLPATLFQSRRPSPSLYSGRGSRPCPFPRPTSHCPRSARGGRTASCLRRTECTSSTCSSGTSTTRSTALWAARWSGPPGLERR